VILWYLKSRTLSVQYIPNKLTAAIAYRIGRPLENETVTKTVQSSCAYRTWSRNSGPV